MQHVEDMGRFRVLDGNVTKMTWNYEKTEFLPLICFEDIEQPCLKAAHTPDEPANVLYYKIVGQDRGTVCCSKHA